MLTNLENHPMVTPKGDTTLGGDNSRSIRSYVPILDSIVDQYVSSNAIQVHLLTW
jgi:hypothetical protein